MKSQANQATSKTLNKKASLSCTFSPHISRTAQPGTGISLSRTWSVGIAQAYPNRIQSHWFCCWFLLQVSLAPAVSCCQGQLALTMPSYCTGKAVGGSCGHPQWRTCPPPLWRVIFQLEPCLSLARCKHWCGPSSRVSHRGKKKAGTEGGLLPAPALNPTTATLHSEQVLRPCKHKCEARKCSPTPQTQQEHTEITTQGTVGFLLAHCVQVTHFICDAFAIQVLAVLGQRLDSMVLKVFFNLNDSTVLWLYRMFPASNNLFLSFACDYSGNNHMDGVH